MGKIAQEPIGKNEKASSKNLTALGGILYKRIVFIALFLCSVSVYATSEVDVQIIRTATFHPNGSEKTLDVHLGEPLTHYGLQIPISGVYTIQLKNIPKDPEEPFGILLGRVQNADRTFFDGDLIGENGGFFPYKPDWLKKRIYQIPNSLLRSESSEHILQVEIECREVTFDCGIAQDPIEIGFYSDLREQLIVEDSTLMILLTLVLAIFIQQGIAYSIIRKSKASMFLASAALLLILWRLPFVNKINDMVDFEFRMRTFYFAQSAFPIGILGFLPLPRNSWQE